MNSLIIFGIFCVMMLIGAIMCGIADKVAETKEARKRSKDNFILTHPNYTRDAKGKAIKRV